jgi:hypothetical protein
MPRGFDANVWADTGAKQILGASRQGCGLLAISLLTADFAGATKQIIGA